MPVWPPASVPCATSTSAPGVERELGIGERLHLADDSAPGVPGTARPVPRVGERERDGRRPGLEGGLEVALGELEERRDEPDGERSIGSLAHQRRLRRDPLRTLGHVDAAERAHATGGGDRRREGPAAVHRHRRRHDRVLEPEHLGEPSTDHLRTVRRTARQGHWRSGRNGRRCPNRQLPSRPLGSLGTVGTTPARVAEGLRERRRRHD